MPHKLVDDRAQQSLLMMYQKLSLVLLKPNADLRLGFGCEANQIQKQVRLASGVDVRDLTFALEQRRRLQVELMCLLQCGVIATGN